MYESISQEKICDRVASITAIELDTRGETLKVPSQFAIACKKDRDSINSKFGS